MERNNIRWIFFDIDDTLWDFATNSLNSLTNLYNTHNILQHSFHSIQDFLDAYHALNAKLWDDYASSKIDADFLKTERFRGIIWPDENHFDAKQNQIDICTDLNNHYLDYLASLTALNPDAILTLQALQKYFLIGALTNGFSSVQYKKIYNTGLWRYIQRMIISEETPWRKPDVELFKFAEQAVGAFPDECLMVGDNKATDIAGARDAGWHSIYFSKSGDGDISRLSELLPLLIPQSLRQDR